MKSLLILRHSALQILRQPVSVFQIFFLPNLVTFVVFKLSGLAFVFSPIHLQVAMMRGAIPWGLFVGVSLLGLGLSWWSALAWHRFILLGEYPKYPWPPVAWAAVGPFLKAAAVVCLAVFALVFCASFVIGIVMGVAMAVTKHAPGWAAYVVAGALSVPIMIPALRLALGLPNAAVLGAGELGKVWRSTRGTFWTFVAIFACLFTIRYGLNVLLPRYGLTPFSSLGYVVVAVAEVLQAIFTLSIVTTLYGHHVEGRPLV